MIVSIHSAIEVLLEVPVEIVQDVLSSAVEGSDHVPPAFCAYPASPIVRWEPNLPRDAAQRVVSSPRSQFRLEDRFPEQTPSIASSRRWATTFDGIGRSVDELASGDGQQPSSVQAAFYGVVTEVRPPECIFAVTKPDVFHRELNAVV